jgi:hypothetical protein
MSQQIPGIEAVRPEYLTTSAAFGQNTGEPMVLVTMRLTPGSFKPNNLILSRETAIRLHRELGEAIANPHTPQPERPQEERPKRRRRKR